MRKVFQDFARTIRLAAPPDAVRAALLDVRRVASWLSIVHDVRDVEPARRYAAVLEDKLGPFALRADLDVTVDTPDTRVVHVAAQGEDRQVASRITATIDLAVDQDGSGTTLSVNGRYEISGRVATLGAGAIRKKGDRLLDEFFLNLAAGLAD
jgi:carbon monoxide dehydrogenase subunit G